MRNNEKRLGMVPGGPQPSDVAGASQQGSPLAFVVPTEFVELPSKGAFYPEGHPLHGEDTIEIKFMTAKEEDILTSMTLIKKGVVLERLINNLVLDERIKSTDLFVGDRNAIMIATRKSAYGSSYSTKVTCPECNAPHDEEYDLNEIEYSGKCFDKEFLKENKITVQSKTGDFEVELPKSKVVVGVQLMTGQDEQQLAKIRKERVEEADVTDLLFTIISSVNGVEDRYTIKNFVDSMPAMDSKHLRKLYSQLVPNIDFKRVFVCQKCYSVADLEVPFTTAFFWPE